MGDKSPRIPEPWWSPETLMDHRKKHNDGRQGSKSPGTRETSPGTLRILGTRSACQVPVPCYQRLKPISPALQPNSKRTICDWQRLGPAAWISDRVLPTWFPESINRPHIRAGVLKISRGTDNVKSSCTHRQSTRKRTCANLLTIVPTVIAAQ